jgi:ATP-dependent RNA helicase MSS116
MQQSCIFAQLQQNLRRGKRHFVVRSFTTTTVDAANDLLSSSSSQRLPNLHKPLQERLLQLGWNIPTEIQAKTWQAAKDGRDVLGRSRTGSGKTMAFLLPTLQRSMTINNNAPTKIKLILSPTRDLAQQIDEQIKILYPLDASNHHNDHIVIVGGVDKRREIKRWQETTPQFITATPGRLRDHLENTENTFVRDYLQNVNVLILDEVDHLLEMGFKDDIDAIIQQLPQQRQNLLFSATISPSIQRELVTRGWIHSNHLFVDCISDAAATEVQEDPFDMEHDADNKLTTATAPTLAHTHVSQSHVVLPSHRLVTGIAQIVLTLLQQEDKNAKILVFFPTTSMVVYFTRLFQWALGRHVWSMHGQKSQMARNVTRQAFAAASRGVLFTTDVSARGMDYPSITNVVQIGVPASRDAYIHRLGRTGRGMDRLNGKGLLVLFMQQEEKIMKRELQDMEIPLDESLSRLLDRPVWLDLELELTQFAHDMKQGELPEMVKEAESVYKSLLSIYQLQLKEDTVVETMNSLAAQMGLSEPPVLEENQAAYLGLSKNPLLNIHRPWKVGQRFDVGRRRT